MTAVLSFLNLVCPCIVSISVAAMADIAFLLLIFFMVTSSFIEERSLDVELPSVISEKMDEKEQKQITVFVSARTLKLNDDELKLWQLADKLRKMLQGKETPEDRVVFLDGHGDTFYETVINVVDEINKAGGILSLVTTTTEIETGEEAKDD